MTGFGFKYEVDVEATEKQGGGGDFSPMPDMNAVLEVTACAVTPRPDGEGHEAAITIEVIEPEQFKGRKMWATWTVNHPLKMNDKKYSFGKPRFDKLCRAVAELDPQEPEDLMFKQFVATVGTNWGGPDGKGGRYKDKNEVVHWFYPDENAPEPYPEIGIIEGGIPGRAKGPIASASAPAPANDNRPARAPANDNAPARAAGAKPWAKKAS